MNRIAAALVLLPLALTVQDPEPDALTLRFGWPHEGQVQVRESSLKKGATAEIAYTLRWSPDEQGESFVIAYEDYRFLSINGQAASTPAVKAIVERIAPLMKAIPRMRISSAGQLAEFLGLDEVFEAVLDELPEDQRNLEPMRIMYTRVKRKFRPFSFLISALFRCANLQTVENHDFSRNGEEGVWVNPLYDKGLIKLHSVIYA